MNLYFLIDEPLCSLPESQASSIQAHDGMAIIAFFHPQMNSL